jgi:tetratricopeptide (TPR) repeat protein
MRLQRARFRTQYSVLSTRYSVLLFVALLVTGCSRPQPTTPPTVANGDPRAAQVTPYRNVAPGVKYVGDAACAQCHLGQAETFRQHPMGRSLAPLKTAASQDRYDEAAGNPFKQLGVEFHVERQGERVRHKALRRDGQGHELAELDDEVEFVLGSGTRGKSYLINHNGYLFQSPISWFTQKQTWDLSPGYVYLYPGRRAVAVECLFCHCNHADAVEDTLNRFREPIFQGYAVGCERCHGPGELHVQSRQRGDAPADLDDTIVNPGQLKPLLRDSVCEQCHLQGEARVARHGRRPFDYRPGLPLYAFQAVFERRPELAQERKAVGQVEQMYESHCYKESKGTLGCISCHDPHELPASRTAVAYYRNRCSACHQEAKAGDGAPGVGDEKKACSLARDVRQKKNGNNCVACHMPRGNTDVAHTALTDHRILRDPQLEDRSPPRTALSPDDVPLVPFYPESEDYPTLDRQRDLGIALMQVARMQIWAQVSLGKAALPLLEAAVEAWPDDLAAHEARAAALWTQGRNRDALAAYEALLAKAPRREQALLDVATVCEQLNDEERALAFGKRLVDVNPWGAGTHYQLAKLLAQRRQWQEAIVECRKAVDLNPAKAEPRVLLIDCYLHEGDKKKARAEFAKLQVLKPADLDVLRRWFAERSQ